jgi:cysteine desulfurase
MEQIYLDHNSTTPIDPSVAEEMQRCYAAGYVNPASQHRLGQQARRILEQHRTEISSNLGAQTGGMQTDSLVFTSGGTESNNLALIGLAMSALNTRKTAASGAANAHPGRILISSIEHPSILGAAEHLVRLGFDVQPIPVDSHGVCCLEALAEMLSQPADVVSLMLANNETGVLQPIGKAAKLCRDKGVFFHTDAVQAVGKISVNFRNLGVDAMSFTAHKFSGPRGVGGLLIRSGVNVEPILFGGFQQMAIRPGTEDVALVAGMSQALRLFDQQPARIRRVQELRDLLQAELVSSVKGGVVIGGEVDRVPQTLNFAFRGIDRQAFLLAADMAGLAVSTGSACASGSSELSPALLAMGLPSDVIEGAIRISLGVSNSRAEIVQASHRIIKIANDLQRGK